MENYNSMVRKTIYNQVKVCANYGLPLKDSAYLYAVYLSFIGENKISKVYKDYITIVSFLDAYKIYSHKNKENILTKEELLLFQKLVNILSFDDLKMEIKENLDFFSSILKSSYEFYEMSGLGKINVVFSLSEVENQWLEFLFPIHNQDISHYKKDLHLEDLMKNYENQLRYQAKNSEMPSEYIITYNITEFIRNLCKNNYEKGNQLLYEIGQMDYLICNYLKNEAEINDRFEYHASFYENNTSSSILWKLEKDQEFLLEAIGHLSYRYIHHQYEDIEISENDLSIEDKKVFEKKIEPKKP